MGKPYYTANKSRLVEGKYRFKKDGEIYIPESRKGQDDDGWFNNLIVDSIGLFLAGTIVPHSSYPSRPNIWIAWGTGNTAPVVGDTTLETEVYREEVAAIDYIDNTGTCTPNLTNILQFTGQLGTGEAPFALEEFGLFGGTATSSADSGEMIDRVVMPLEDRTVTADPFEVEIRITF